MERSMYNDNEVVTLSLERYEQLKSDSQYNKRGDENFRLLSDKLFQLGYVLVSRHDEPSCKIVLKEDFDREEDQKKQNIAGLNDYSINRKFL